MKYCRRICAKPCRRNNRAGFTLVEVVIVITVFLAISAGVIVNWSSFIQYQDMRRTAQNFHKELVGLKASALENGVEYKIEYSDGGNSYTVVKIEDGAESTVRTEEFPKNVVLKGFPAQNSEGETIDYGSGDCSCAAWDADNGGILIKPSNLDPFTTGRIAITRKGAEDKKMFCIAKDGSEVNPRIFFRSNEDNEWKKL